MLVLNLFEHAFHGRGGLGLPTICSSPCESGHEATFRMRGIATKTCNAPIRTRRMPWEMDSQTLRAHLSLHRSISTCQRATKCQFSLCPEADGQSVSCKRGKYEAYTYLEGWSPAFPFSLPPLGHISIVPATSQPRWKWRREPPVSATMCC